MLADVTKPFQPGSARGNCKKCGTPLGRFTPNGVCPRCLLQAALLESENDSVDGVEEFKGDRGVGSFGDYELVEEIAYGGMGIVYRARQMSLNRIVALKMILTGQFARETEIKRFRAEAEAAAQLDHPNIVPIYEVGERNGQHFFSMRFMEGGTLTRRINDPKSRLPNEAAVQLLVKVCRAVHFAHQRGILHRDLKPGNILLSADGEPYVSDFGLAKILEGASQATASGSVMGSPSYMSPEQAVGKPGQVSTAADVYSLGAILYEMLTGQPPFRADTPLATLRLVVEQEPKRPSTINLRADRDLETICLMCLDKEPARRYGSAELLAEDLERWLRHEPILARQSSPTERLGKWMRRHPTSAALVFISSLAILAFLVGQTIMSIRLSRANTKVSATNQRLQSSLHEMQWRRADEAAQTGERDEAIAWLAHFVRQNPNDAIAAARLLSLLSECNFPVMLSPPLAHDSQIIAIDCGESGEHLVTVTAGKMARLWNVKTGKLEFELPHPSPLSHGILCGVNDERLLTITTEPKARLWDLNRRQLLKEISLGQVNERSVGRHALFSRDRRQLALNVESNAVGVLNVESGSWVMPPEAFPQPIQSFAFSADARFLATGSQTGVQLWEVASRKRALSVVTPGLRALELSENGRWLAYLTEDGIRVTDTSTGNHGPQIDIRALAIAYLGNTNDLVVIDANGAPLLFDFHTGKNRGSPFGQLKIDWQRYALLESSLFHAKGADRMLLLDTATGRPLSEAFYHDGWIERSKLHPNGKMVTTTAQDRSVRIWSVQMQRVEPIALAAGGPVWEAQWNPAGDRILSAAVVNQVTEMRLWHGQTGEPLTAPWQRNESVFLAAWSHDGSRFATATHQGSGCLWNGQTGVPISDSLRHDGPMLALVFSPDGKFLASAADDSSVRFWDGSSGAALGSPLPHSQAPFRIAFSPEGQRLASACQDGTVRVWSVPEGKLLLGPLQHDGTCWVATFSPDGRSLASASSDGTVRLWDAANGQPRLPPIRHESPVLWVAFSPDGRSLATSTDSGLVRVLDVATGASIAGPMRHPGRIWTVKWSPDGQFLATICTDGKARIWHAASGHLAAEPFAHEKEVRRVQFSPDMRRLLTGAFDGKVKMWDLTTLRPPMPAPDWLPGLAEALSGKRIGENDTPKTVAGDSFFRSLNQIAQAPSTNNYYRTWAHWMLNERFGPLVKPFRP